MNPEELELIVIALEVEAFAQEQIAAAVKVECTNDTDAKTLHSMLEIGLDQIKSQITASGSPPMGKLVSHVLGNLQLELADNTISGNIGVPLDLLFAAMEDTQKKVSANQIGIDLANIGLALHNHHDIFNRLPAAQGARNRTQV